MFYRLGLSIVAVSVLYIILIHLISHYFKMYSICIFYTIRNRMTSLILSELIYCMDIMQASIS
jgi:hypothetical protein